MIDFDRIWENHPARKNYEGADENTHWVELGFLIACRRLDPNPQFLARPTILIQNEINKLESKIKHIEKKISLHQSTQKLMSTVFDRIGVDIRIQELAKEKLQLELELINLNEKVSDEKERI